MKKSEIIKKLNEFSEDMEVFVPSRTGDYEYGKSYSVYELKITMQNDDIIDAIVIDES